MRKGVADSVLARSLELLSREPTGRVSSSVQPKLGSSISEFQVEHRVRGGLYAQFIQLLLSQMCCSPVQLTIERECVCSEKDDWVLRQSSFDVVEMYSAHVCDSLFGGMPQSESAADAKWESEVRMGLGEAYPGQMKVFLGQSQSAGREIVVWGIPGEAHAQLVHLFLLHRFSEMHSGIHFDSSPLERLEITFRSVGWVAAAREH